MKTFFFFFFWRSPEKFLRRPLFLENTCACVLGPIPVLGLESVCPRKGCPWPWPRIFFCVLGLGLEPCVLDSTSDVYSYTMNAKILKLGMASFLSEAT